MGMTIAEKILANKSGLNEVKPGDIVEARVDTIMLHDIGTPGIKRPFEAMNVQSIPSSVECVIIPDHFIPAPTVDAANNLKLTREFAKKMNVTAYYEIGRGGICHAVMVEKGHVQPGKIIIGPDSHTTTYGACGAFGTGFGVTDVAIALATGQIWLKVPETIKVKLTGKLQEKVSAKDVSMFLLEKFGEDGLIYKSLEPFGEIIEDMSIDGRLTLADMALEMGAKVCLMEQDEKMISYLDQRTGKKNEPVSSDPDANYARYYEYDLSALSPMVAAPHTLSNVKKIEEVEGTSFHQAYLGSCTNGRMTDMRVAAEILKGKKVHPDIRFIVTPASQDVYNRCMKEGILEIFTEAGALVTHATCGACVGGHLGLIGDGEVCVSTSNRNFCGRMGSRKGEVYLTSPEVVTASAIAGKIVDPRKEGGE